MESTMRTQVESKFLREQIRALREEYDELWKIIIVILDAMEGKEMRIHNSQFLRFKEEYRIDREFDSESDEVILRLKGLVE